MQFPALNMLNDETFIYIYKTQYSLEFNYLIHSSSMQTISSISVAFLEGFNLD